MSPHQHHQKHQNDLVNHPLHYTAHLFLNVAEIRQVSVKRVFMGKEKARSCELGVDVIDVGRPEFGCNEQSVVVAFGLDDGSSADFECS